MQLLRPRSKPQEEKMLSGSSGGACDVMGWNGRMDAMGWCFRIPRRPRRYLIAFASPLSATTACRGETDPTLPSASNNRHRPAERDGEEDDQGRQDSLHPYWGHTELLSGIWY